MMMSIRQWFNGLPRREQYLLLLGAVIVLVWLLLLLYQGIASDRQRYSELNSQARGDLALMRETVATIESLRRSDQRGVDVSGRSLAQLSEQAAGKADIRINRFAPAGDNEAQLWFERVPFNALLQALAALELEYGIVIDSIAINSANAPGLVNARMRISR